MEESVSFNQIRERFSRFFEDHQHMHVPSASLVPDVNPTVLFTSSGIDQFKPIVELEKDPVEYIGSTKVFSLQKVIRTGGKHNDLDIVGRHHWFHAFFEVLGFWSFGNYGKETAIAQMWDLLTNYFGLSAEVLYITYYEGGSTVAADLEAKEVWLTQGVKKDHILPAKRNLWDMGETGPCGTSCVIFVDRRDLEKLSDPPKHPFYTDPEILEVSELVFIEYNRSVDGSMTPLPRFTIDCGMGFERVVATLQRKPSSYETDLFAPIIHIIHSVSGCRAYTSHYGPEDLDGVDTAYRVVADHVRALTFALSDGARMGSSGRGHVLRRILRRACYFAEWKLGIELGEFLSKLVPAVVETMSLAYPELGRKVESIQGILREEEVMFSRVLKRGERQLHKILQKAKAKVDGLARTTVIDGKEVWKLYESSGFPVEMALDIIARSGTVVDTERLREAEEQAKAKSRGES